ncbi:far upstream element-binding protein 1 isoform X2 [Olea europaea var. sylvestris]|uniref:far upstream element-binding protein 1 isoform X2 n=1 Tax=Olea europaea var. sylvestris TaxID=158386 RepID=UPI000C1D15A2|nr:far upstream element-binding protein 1 isoform X2 [Olea europaea var. sylvestris]
MAEKVQYASVDGESNKRKYDDPSPVERRPTGFSSPPESNAPSSYNSGPPPVNEIELAKLKAQEIAARFLNNVDPTKRARVENGAGGGGGFDSNDSILGQKSMGLAFSGPPQGASYGYPAPNKKIEIPNGRVGVIIGKGGETIKYLQLQSGAKIQVTRDMDADPNSASRGVELMGTPEQVAKAEQLIKDVLAEADAGGSGVASLQSTGLPSGAEQLVMKIPNNKVGLVIGKGGEAIKDMQARSGARIQVIPLHLPPGDTSKERTVQIDGTREQIEAAKLLVNEVTSENRSRNPAMTGGYPQQGYQTRPPMNWAQPGPPMQQPGYGYAQPGDYPGPSPQYNTNQSPYPGYPPQPPSGGYSIGWDQTTAPENQQAAQGGGYDYYSQQQPPQPPTNGGPGAPADGSAYGYHQPPPYSQGQGYPQDSYGGYNMPAPQSGYGQSQPNPVPGYDQQGYNSTYGNTSNPAPDGQTAAYGTLGDASQVPATGQAHNAGGQPGPNPNSAIQGSTQPSYGVPPTSQVGYATQHSAGYGPIHGPPNAQKPPTSQPTYGQLQQLPSAQGGYVQPGYPHSQPPTSSYPTSQPGYGPPPYGAPPQPPAYNSYGGGYSQPPAYSSDGNSGASAHGSYDATPPSKTVLPSGAAQASPSS